jgi:hypothetical protein
MVAVGFGTAVIESDGNKFKAVVLALLWPILLGYLIGEQFSDEV